MLTIDQLAMLHAYARDARQMAIDDAAEGRSEPQTKSELIDLVQRWALGAIGADVEAEATKAAEEAYGED